MTTEGQTTLGQQAGVPPQAAEELFAELETITRAQAELARSLDVLTRRLRALAQPGVVPAAPPAAVPVGAQGDSLDRLLGGEFRRAPATATAVPAAPGRPLPPPPAPNEARVPPRAPATGPAPIRVAASAPSPPFRPGPMAGRTAADVPEPLFFVPDLLGDMPVGNFEMPSPPMGTLQAPQMTAVAPQPTAPPVPGPLAVAPPPPVTTQPAGAIGQPAPQPHVPAAAQVPSMAVPSVAVPSSPPDDGFASQAAMMHDVLATSSSPPPKRRLMRPNRREASPIEEAEEAGTPLEGTSTALRGEEYLITPDFFTARPQKRFRLKR